MVASSQEREQVEAVIHEWNAAANAKDVARLKALWDQDYPQLLYIAEENDEALSDWASISRYYDALPELVLSLDWKIDGLKVDVVGGVAYAYLSYLVRADVRGIDHTMVLRGRNTFVLHRSWDSWRLIHYHESLSRDHNQESWSWFWS